MSVQGFPDDAVLWIDGLPKADGLQWASTHMLLTWMQSEGKWNLSSLPDGWQDHPSLPVLGLTASAPLGVQFADSRSRWREFSISIILIIHLFLGSSVSTFISSSILLALFLWRTLIPAPRLVLLHRFALKPNYWDRAAKQWVLGLAVSKERVGLGSREGSSSEKSHACSPPPPNHNQLGKQCYFQMQPPHFLPWLSEAHFLTRSHSSPLGVVHKKTCPWGCFSTKPQTLTMRGSLPQTTMGHTT